MKPIKKVKKHFPKARSFKTRDGWIARATSDPCSTALGSGRDAAEAWANAWRNMTSMQA